MRIRYYVRQNYTNVSLHAFNSDILIFSESRSIHKLPIKDLQKLEYLGDSKSPKGFIIGAAIGFSFAIAASILLSGGSFDGHSEINISPGGAILGGLVFAVIGGMIGGSIQGTHRENFKVDFSNLSLNQAREKIKNTLSVYGGYK